MKKTTQWILAILIAAFALVSIYINFVLIIGSGFIFGDIDHTEAQMQAAQTKATILSVFGIIGFCISILILFLCGKISKFILKLVDI